MQEAADCHHMAHLLFWFWIPKTLPLCLLPLFSSYPCVSMNTCTCTHPFSHSLLFTLQWMPKATASQMAHNLPTDRLAPMPCHTIPTALPVVLPSSPTQLLSKRRDTPHPLLSPAMPPLGPWYVPSSIFLAPSY